jgi:peptidoglycan glycosyltransferase
MNKTLQRVTIAAILLIALVMIRTNWIQGVEANALKNNPNNPNLYFNKFSHDRGPIMAGTMVLAQSNVTSKSGNNTSYQRSYNDSTVFSPVTGFINTYQSTGIEGAEDSLLEGTDKRLTLNNWFDELIGKQAKGATVDTTINPAAQRVAYRDLANRTSIGAAVAINVQTGAIEALASFPSYDANGVSSNDTTKANNTYNRLAKKNPSPLLNEAMNQTFAPGSSFKIIDSATAFTYYGITPQTPENSSTLTLPSGHVLTNDDDGGACGGGSPPLIESFAQSCNSTFGRLAMDTLGSQKLNQMAKAFGWHQNINVEDGLTSAASNFPPGATADDLARAGIGQGDTTATPLQMAMAAQAIANNGKEMKPYLVQQVLASDQSEVVTASPQVFGNPISSDVAVDLQEMMREVVTSGTAATTIGDTDLAGKTGTAQAGSNNQFNQDWFVGYAPYNDPKIAFAVVTKEASGTTGAQYSAPIAADIVKAVLGSDH